MSLYTWDLDKAATNLVKHGISFDDAKTVADDPLHHTRPDTRNVSDSRMITIGSSKEGHLLVVVTSESGPQPRIISARRATKRERHAYESRP